MSEKASPSKGRVRRAIGGKVSRLVKAVPVVGRAKKAPDPVAEAVRRAAKRAKVDKTGAFLVREDDRPDVEEEDAPTRRPPS
ncbi:MAG: hypothetical protein FJX66_15155 [Alphaproteobacteria bacterium]|nr:hypothetical protein [Alphaproteobacteria bacterium]